MVSVVHAQSLTATQVLQRVIDHYPSIKIASIQVERTRQEAVKLDSQFGWNLSANAGISKNVSLFGISSNKLEAGGSLSRQLDSGSTLSIAASLAHEDGEVSFSPLFPNPATNTRIDLMYREPLSKGADNPAYVQGKRSAAASLSIKEAEKEKLYDQLAQQVIELHLAAAATTERMANLENAIKRSKRLQQFIIKREKIGISEEKDLLQVKAQLRSQQAELGGLKIAWEKQRIAINRLMGVDPTRAYDPKIEFSSPRHTDFEKTYKRAAERSPDAKTFDGQIELAASQVELRRDDKSDNLDLVLFVGANNQSGDTAGGSVSNSDVVGGASIEFSQSRDKTGLDAQLYEAQLARSAAIEGKKQILKDLRYEVASLIAEIDAGVEAVALHKKSVQSERLKLKEAEERYKTGRADTDQIVQFESQLSGAELALELQQIELVKQSLLLALKTGELWQRVNKPQQFDVEIEQ